VVLIDEWRIAVEGPDALTRADVGEIRSFVQAAIDQFCRQLEAELGLRRGSVDIYVTASQ